VSDADSWTDLSRNVHRFAETQGGHVTWAQLLETGMTTRTATRWIARGHLIRVYHGVYAVGHLQNNPINRAHAALLAGGPRCGLAGAAAMVLWGQWKRWPDPLEIVIAENRRPSGLIVHHSKTLLKRDIAIVDGLRVTSPARTALDMAPRLSESQLTRTVNDLRLTNVLTMRALDDVVARNPRYAGAPLLRPLIETAQREPTRSELEDAFLALVRRYDLPVPEINVHVAGYRVDALFPDHSLVVELDGWGSHKSRYAFNRDRRQDADILAATGMPTVRLPYDDTLNHHAETAERLKRLLRRRNPLPDQPDTDDSDEGACDA
jgi:very-short-patch-repair endonuclease